MDNPLKHTDVIDRVITLLDEKYVYPEMGQQIITHLRERVLSYGDIADAEKLAQTVTDDMQSISHDKHLRLRHDPSLASALQTQTDADSLEAFKEWINHEAANNFGFQKLEWLAGGIGYLDLRMFVPPFAAGEIAVGAMAFLANAKALIYDLRKNVGGAPEMVQFMLSYLFDDELHHLNDLYHRYNDTHTHYWTLPYVPGKRMPDTPVYVLTSSRTFSGAEEFSYNLKSMDRATLVGETTGGGAHPGIDFAVNDLFTLFVPGGRPINPITKTNWEGTGVTPHIECPADDALRVAHKLALEKLIEKAASDGERQSAQKALETL